MNGIPKASLFSLSLLLMLATTAAKGARDPGPEEGAATMPAAFVAGTYEVIGRYPDSAELYAGTMTIDLPAAGSKALSITRVINGVTHRGSGVLETTPDAVVVLRVELEGGTVEASYLIGSDLDNYARLTGYVYAKNGDTRLPGIEALFHDHYQDR